MNKFLTRTLSGAVYVALVVFAIYSSPLLHSRVGGFFIFTGLFLLVALVATGEVYRNLALRGIAVNRWAGYLVGVLTYVGVTLFNILELDEVCSFSLYLCLPALWMVVPLCQLWRHDEHPFATVGYTLLPVVWVVVPLLLLQQIGNLALGLLMMVFLCTWMNDTGAYLSGMAFGKHKLWERHSPKKTWEGSLGGLVLSVVVAVGVGPLLVSGLAWWYWCLIALICSVVGTLGDLVESMFKRFCGVKDSGRIMPGHGGLLDRFDSILMIAPFIIALFELGRLI